MKYYFKKAFYVHDSVSIIISSIKLQILIVDISTKI